MQSMRMDIVEHVHVEVVGVTTHRLVLERDLLGENDRVARLIVSTEVSIFHTGGCPASTFIAMISRT